MAGEKRSFPFTELEISTNNASANRWKRQCILSSDCLKRHDSTRVSNTEEDSTASHMGETEMDYENCTHIYHQNGHIALRDFQNGYDIHVDGRFKNGHSLLTNGSIRNGHSLNSAYSIQNGHAVQTDFSGQNEQSVPGGALSNENNNNTHPESSLCIRCQAGEPGHIGHIGR